MHTKKDVNKHRRLQAKLFLAASIFVYEHVLQEIDIAHLTTYLDVKKPEDLFLSCYFAHSL